MLDIRFLTDADIDQFEALLKPRTAEAYFLRSNRMKAGFAYTGKALSAVYLGAFDQGAMVGAMAYTWINTLLFYAEKPEVLDALTEAMIPLIHARGGKIEAVLGLRDQAARVERKLGLTQDNLRRNSQDYLFKLALDALVKPKLLEDPAVQLRLANANDAAEVTLMQAWRVAFNLESLGGTAGPALDAKVRDELARKLDNNEIYVLTKNNQPVATCSFMGEIPEQQIIGAVWTPPENRGRGYAKAVVAGALLHAQRQNPALTDAVLFAERPDAIAVYKALGFRQIGDWRLALVRTDWRLG